MGRYFSSFLITSLVYLMLFSTVLYSFSNITEIPSKNKPSEQKVKVTLIAQVKEESVPKPIEKKIEKPVKKIVKKEQKKPLKKKKQIVKKTIKQEIKKVSRKPKIKKKEIVKTDTQKSLNKIQKTQIKQNKTIIKKHVPIVDTEKITLQQNAYYANIKKRINQNKSYPKMAVRRAIEGDVKIKFTISQKGELLSFKIVDGKRIFKKSIIKAIKKTFPFAPPKNIFTSNLDLSLTLQYKLY